MLTTSLCRQLGIDSPIFCAPMAGGSAGPELASAVSNAGGLGAIGLVALPAPYIREVIRRTHALTRKPFLANLVIPNLQGGELDACFDEKLPKGRVEPHSPMVIAPPPAPGSPPPDGATTSSPEYGIARWR